MLVSKPEYDDNFTPEIEQRYLNLLEKINQCNNQYKLAQRYSINVEDKIKEVQPACLKTSFPPELVKLREQQESILKKGRISKKFLINPESVVSLSEAIFLLAYVQHNLSLLRDIEFKVFFGKIENALKKQEELDTHLNSLLIQSKKKASNAAKYKAQAANAKSKLQLEKYRLQMIKAIAINWGGDYWETISHFINEQYEYILCLRLDDPSLALNEDNFERRIRQWLREDAELKKLFMFYSKNKELPASIS